MNFVKDRISCFREYLVREERSAATVEKYVRDILRFADYAGNSPLSKELTVSYKNALLKKYCQKSANSMIAALNCFLRFAGLSELCVKQFRLQYDAYCSADKELTRQEYTALVREAERKRDMRLSLTVQTICSTGIRVSELRYVTVEAVEKGEAVVSCKGKTRRVFIVEALRRKLKKYAKEQKIFSGAVFITKGGKPLDRSNVWREMKALCRAAGVCEKKVFPHNLRHLFARTFYKAEKDIAKLADILGHSSINTTRIYIITTCDEHRQRMERMHLIV